MDGKPIRRRGRKPKAEKGPETAQEIAARDGRKESVKLLGEALSSARARMPRADRSLVRLAKKAGVDRNTIHQVEVGNVIPTFDILMRIAKAVGVRLVLQDSSVSRSEDKTELWVYPPWPKF
jgi:predicted transcriptional regulator